MANDTFRIVFQGKQVSQITAYIWRYIDDTKEPEKADHAKKLKQYFAAREQENQDLTKQKINISSFLRVASNLATLKLTDLFKADPKKWLESDKDKGVPPTEEVKLLIAVFGEERIKTDPNYVSPLFSEAELREGEATPHYEFHIDVTSFKGTLSDPDLERSSAFRFNIAFPARPQLGEATVTTEELENWIKDQQTSVPNSIYIPVTT